MSLTRINEQNSSWRKRRRIAEKTRINFIIKVHVFCKKEILGKKQNETYPDAWVNLSPLEIHPWVNLKHARSSLVRDEIHKSFGGYEIDFSSFEIPRCLESALPGLLIPVDLTSFPVPAQTIRPFADGNTNFATVGEKQSILLISVSSLQSLTWECTRTNSYKGTCHKTACSFKPLIATMRVHLILLEERREGKDNNVGD